LLLSRSGARSAERGAAQQGFAQDARCMGRFRNGLPFWR
jgi:hypothetical protein